MGTTQVKLLKAPPQSFILQSAHFRKTSFPTCQQAQQLFLRLVKDLAEKEDVTEQLKAIDMILWVQKINNIRSRATEIVNNKLIYS